MCWMQIVFVALFCFGLGGLAGILLGVAIADAETFSDMP